MRHFDPKRTLVSGAFNNTVFAAAGGFLTLVQSVLAIRLLGPREMGEFAVAAAFGATLEFISDFGVGDRLVQQSDSEIRDAYQLALTAQFLTAIPLWIIILCTAPAIGRHYQVPGLSGLILLMSFQAFGGVCRLPLFLLYRDLKYFQHRLLIFLGKVVAFGTTILLAANGCGAWSLAIGSLVGIVASCFPAWYLSALPPAFRFSKVEARKLLGFTWPVWVSRITLMVVQQGTVLVVSSLLSLAELGQYKSTEQLAHFALLMEVILAQTIYPVLCRAVNDRAQVASIFSRTGRGAMLFVAGAGFGLLIFADQIVSLLLGPKWAGAELFLRAHAVGLLLGALAFNWEALFRALGDTKPIFRVSALYGVSFLLSVYPLTLLFGRNGTAAAVVIVNVVGLIARSYYLNRLGFPTSTMRVVWRAVVSALVASAGVAVFRLAIGPAKTLTSWVLEIAVYLLLYCSVLFRLERGLITQVSAILARREAEPKAC